MLLGIRDPSLFRETFGSIVDRSGSPCEIVILRFPVASDVIGNNAALDTVFTYADMRSTGVFVPKTFLCPRKLSYVDIVQRQPPVEGPEDLALISPGARKLSSNSTISTQPDDTSNWVDQSETEAEPCLSVSNHADGVIDDRGHLEEALKSTISGPSKEKDEKLSFPKKELLAKRRNAGLRAIVPCPTEEPERSISSSIWTYIQGS